jgi:ankyrin repeat protein
VDAIGSPLHLNKRTPLHLAASKGKDQVLKILLDHGADVSCLFLLDMILLVFRRCSRTLDGITFLDYFPYSD